MGKRKRKNHHDADDTKRERGTETIAAKKKKKEMFNPLCIDCSAKPFIPLLLNFKHYKEVHY